MHADPDRDARQRRKSELIRQRYASEHLPDFLGRLGKFGARVESVSPQWMGVAACDAHLSDYDEVRERVLGDTLPLALTMPFLEELESVIGRLCEVIVDDVIAIPRAREVGCVRLGPRGFRDLAIPLLLADGDDLSVASVRTDDGAHLSTYEEHGEQTYELQVWGAQWLQPFTTSAF